MSTETQKGIQSIENEEVRKKIEKASTGGDSPIIISNGGATGGKGYTTNLGKLTENIDGKSDKSQHQDDKKDNSIENHSEGSDNEEDSDEESSSDGEYSDSESSGSNIDTDRDESQIIEKSQRSKKKKQLQQRIENENLIYNECK